MKRMKTLDQRLTERATRLPNGCLRWDGMMHPKGTDHAVPSFADYSTGTSTPRSLRRALWAKDHGSVPANSTVKVNCGTDRCVEREHLAVVSYSEARRSGPRNPLCKAGHDMTDEANVRRGPRGRRNGCATCLREKQRAYSQAEKADGRQAARKRKPVPDAAP